MKLIIFLVLISLSSVIYAQENDDPCAPGKYDRISMLKCQNISIERTDTKLNQLYQELMNRFKEAKNVKRLRKAQRAWLKFIELDCLYEEGTESEGGREWALTYRACIDRHKQQRVKELETFVACTSNACPY